MRTLPPHTAPTRAICVSDLRIQLLVAVCVDMGIRYFQGRRRVRICTAPNKIFNLTYVQFMFSPYAPFCVHRSFRTHVIYPQHTKYIEDIALVVIPYEIYQTSLRRV